MSPATSRAAAAASSTAAAQTGSRRALRPDAARGASVDVDVAGVTTYIMAYPRTRRCGTVSAGLPDGSPGQGRAAVSAVRQDGDVTRRGDSGQGGQRRPLRRWGSRRGGGPVRPPQARPEERTQRIDHTRRLDPEPPVPPRGRYDDRYDDRHDDRYDGPPRRREWYPDERYRAGHHPGDGYPGEGYPGEGYPGEGYPGEGYPPGYA